MIDKLPSEILLDILSYLDYKDLISLCIVNSRLNEVCVTDHLWKHQCWKYWNSSKLSHESNWKTHFSAYYMEHGRYVNCYKPIKEAWDKILLFMSKNYPYVRAAINVGASERELDEAETKLNLKFPDELRCSLRIHNGQRLTTMGLFGTMSIQNHFRSESLLDISTSTTCQSMFTNCIPLTVCVDSGVAQFLTLTDTNGMKKGTVFYPSDVHTSLGTRHFCAFISADSYLEWLTSFGRQLEAEEFLVDSQLYRFCKVTQVQETTSYITVTVRTCFMPELSSMQPPNFFHTYRISMSMADDAPKSEFCQLETRHWLVIDEDGKEERVEGPGVVGEFPIMRAGEVFSWTSATSFKTTYGTMKGYFTMRNLQTGAKVHIACPPFHMKCLPYVTALEDETSRTNNHHQD